MSKQELDDEKVEVEETEVETEESKETEVETEETETETDSESQDEDESKNIVPPDDKEDELITLTDGSKVTYEELVAGYMKDADYRRKTAELAKERQTVRIEPEKPVSKQDEADPVLSKYDKQQLEDFKVIAKKLGFVAKDDLEIIESQKSKQETISAFFATHKEYAKEHDPTDARYNALLDELQLYNLDGAKDSKVVQRILEKAHEAVDAKFSTVREKAKVMAQKARIKAAAIGSGGSGGTAKEEEGTNYTPEQIAVMKRMGVYDETE